VTIEESKPMSSDEALDELLSKVSALGPSAERALKKLALQFHSKDKEEDDSSDNGGNKDETVRRLLHELLRVTGTTLTLQPTEVNFKNTGV